VAEIAEIARDKGAGVLLAQLEPESEFHRMTALHVAAGCEQREVIDFLLRQDGARAIVNAKDKYGRTPLELAAVFGSRKAADALLAAGASGTATCGAAAFRAARYGRAELLELLLPHCADDPASHFGWRSGAEKWTHQDLVAQLYAWSRGEHPVQAEARAVSAACEAAGLPADLERLCAAYVRVPCDDAAVLKQVKGDGDAVMLADLAPGAATLAEAMAADRGLLGRLKNAIWRQERLDTRRKGAQPLPEYARLYTTYDLLERKSAWVDSHGADHHFFMLAGVYYMHIRSEHDSGFRGRNGTPTYAALLLPPGTLDGEYEMEEWMDFYL
jgi:hypothetical protein